MRAKIVKTGEIKEIHRISNNGSVVYFLTGEENRIVSYKIEDVEIIDYIDWEQRRYELAKAALNGMLAHSRNGHGYQPRDPQMNWHDAIAEEAIEIADAVIEKLKEQ